MLFSFFWVTNSFSIPVTLTGGLHNWNSSTPPPTSTLTGDYREGIIITGGATLNIIGLNGLLSMQMNNNTAISINNGDVFITNSRILMGTNCVINLTGTLGIPHSLTLDQTTIEPASGVFNWTGIELLQQFTGTPSQYQIPPASGPDGNCSSSQWAGTIWPTIGQVNIINGSYIKHAEVGVRCGKKNVGAPYYTDGGGVVRVRNSTFENCNTGISITGFSQSDLPNASFIMSSDFIWNNDLTFGTSNLTHINFEQLLGSGVNIGGCNLTNNHSTINNAANRGKGIRAIDSDFYISKDGDKCCEGENGKCPDNCFTNTAIMQRPNTFNNLGHGIWFDGYWTTKPEGKFACRFSDFKNCANSIYVEDAIELAIADNTFENIPTVFDDFFPNSFLTNTEIFDITAENCTGMRIYDNKFEHSSEFVVSIKLTPIGKGWTRYTSFIRKNTFKSNITVLATCGPQIIAIDLFGDNDNLDITCNNFINQVYDIKVEDWYILDDIPNMADHPSNEILAENSYSSLPPETNPSIPDFQHLTLGCSSNIYNETGTTSVGHRKITSSTSFNMRFHPLSRPNINPLNEVVQISWSASNCVDCSTNCDKLGIKKIPPHTSGINKSYDRGSFIVYPNPSSSNITLIVKNINLNKNATFKIIDLQGQTIYEGLILNIETTLDLAQMGLSDGIYTVMIQTPSMSAFQKLIYFK